MRIKDKFLCTIKGISLTSAVIGSIMVSSLISPVSASAVEKIKFYFPTSVQGRLAQHMKEVVKAYNKSQTNVKVTAVYTGSYQETMVKAAAAVEAGNPPAVAMLGANNILDFVQHDRLVPIQTFLSESGTTTQDFLADFWPGVHANAKIDGKLYAIPFQNSTPILFYNAEHFKEVGLDPDKPPKNWQDLISYGQKLVKKKGKKTIRYGLMMPMQYDYGNWILQAFVMSNGGQYFNPEYPGEVYYDSPTTRGALQFYHDLAHKYGIMPAAVTPSKQVAADFFAGRTSMMIASTGGLTSVRQNAQFKYKVAFVPGNVRNAVPVGGASMVIFKGLTPGAQNAAWDFVSWITSAEQLGSWSRASGYFAPRKSAYDLPEMKVFLEKYPDAGVAVKQLQYTKPWYSTYNVLAVARPMGNAFQAIVVGKSNVVDALKQAQAKADELLKPYNRSRGYALK